jgi:hypothetical protein
MHSIPAGLCLLKLEALHRDSYLDKQDLQKWCFELNTG